MHDTILRALTYCPSLRASNAAHRISKVLCDPSRAAQTGIAAHAENRSQPSHPMSRLRARHEGYAEQKDSDDGDAAGAAQDIHRHQQFWFRRRWTRLCREGEQLVHD